MNPAEWFAGLPTGGKIAVGVGALGVVYYIYKSGGSHTANVVTSPATDTTPTGTTGGGFYGGGGGGVDSSSGHPGGSTQSIGNGGVASVGASGVSTSGTSDKGGNQVKPHNPVKAIVPVPAKPASKVAVEAPHHAAPHKVANPDHYYGSPVGPTAAANRAHDIHNFQALQHLQHIEAARPIDHYQGSPVGPTAAANRAHDRHNYQQLRQVQHNAMPERKPRRRKTHHVSPHHRHPDYAAQRRVARLNAERMQNFRRRGY